MRRLVTRRSGIHGKGVFANIDIAKGTRLIEYKGERITDEESENRYPDTTHTFLFMLDSGEIIDGGSRGNTSRWINHSCDPNCEPMEEGNRLFIHAIRDIKAGDELSYEYNLVIEDRYTPAIKKLYACRCGTRKCQGTFLAKR